MNPRYPSLAFLALVAAPLAAQQPDPAPATDAKTHLLRYALEKGQSGRVVLTQQTEAQMEAGGQKMPRTQVSRVTMRWEVLEVADGSADVRGTVERLQLEMEAPGLGKIEFDSADEETSPPPMLEGIETAVGTTVTYKLSDRGVVSDVSSNRGSGGGMSFEALLVQAGAVLPEEPVAVGGTWDQPLDFPIEMVDAEGTAHYELLGMDGKVARIGVVMELETEAREDAPFPVDAEIEKSAGELTVRLDQPIAPSVSMTTRMKANVAGTMKMDSTITLQIAPAPKQAEEAGGTEPAAKPAGGDGK